MVNISVHLQKFVRESLHPTKVSGQDISAYEFEKWDTFISNEVLRIRDDILGIYLISGRGKGKDVLALAEGIIDLSNQINHYLTRYRKLWRANRSWPEIKSHYITTCQEFEDLLNLLYKRFPTVCSKSGYTDFIIGHVKQKIKNLLNEAMRKLTGEKIDHESAAIFEKGIRNLVNQDNFRRKDDNYLCRLMNLVLKTDFSNTDNFFDFLIINDFNLPEFFLFCVEKWSNKLMDQDGLLDQQRLILDIKTALFDLSIKRGMKSPWSKNRLYNELNEFLSERYSIIKERIINARESLGNEQLNSKRKKVLINFSVAQFGLFIRLQIEKGILANEHIGELFAFFARNFYTPNTEFISAESLQKKSTDVEHATARKLKALLISMLNWLNTNYNLSNYN